MMYRTRRLLPVLSLLTLLPATLVPHPAGAREPSPTAATGMLYQTLAGTGSFEGNWRVVEHTSSGNILRDLQIDMTSATDGTFFLESDSSGFYFCVRGTVEVAGSMVQGQGQDCGTYGTLLDFEAQLNGAGLTMDGQFHFTYLDGVESWANIKGFKAAPR